MEKLLFPHESDARSAREAHEYVRPNARDLLLPILEGDPLGLEDRIAAAKARRCHLLPLTRALPRCVARIARAALDYSGEGLRPWLDGHVAAVLDALVDEQREDELRDVPLAGRSGFREDEAAYYEVLAPVLAVAPQAARLACVVVNRLPPQRRHAFVTIDVEGRALDRYVADTGLSVPAVRCHLREARAAIQRVVARRAQRERRTG